MRAPIERARRRTRLHALADGLGLAPAEILFDHVRRGGCYAAVPRSAALLGLPDAAVAERARSEGWCWREAQARAPGGEPEVEPELEPQQAPFAHAANQPTIFNTHDALG